MPHLLPNEYRFAHDYCVFLHDLIVAKVRGGMEQGIFDIEFTPTREEQGRLRRLQGAELYEWLDRQYGFEFTAEMDYKLVMRGLLSDFCPFVLEGLRASAKGKLTVAYALFRKPFKDNLFYLEWLLAEPGEFLTAFKTEQPEAIDLGRIEPERRKVVIRQAVEAADEHGIRADFLYDLRYNRQAEYGLAVPWDQANHLITTWARGRTEPQNFNFIFSGPNEWETQWRHVYKIVPYVLYHASRVADALIATIATVDDTHQQMTDLRRDFGFGEWVASLGWTTGSSAALQSILRDEPFPCPSCGQGFRFHSRNLRRFVLRGTIRCSACRAHVVADGSSQSGLPAS